MTENIVRLKSPRSLMLAAYLLVALPVLAGWTITSGRQVDNRDLYGSGNVTEPGIYRVVGEVAVRNVNEEWLEYDAEFGCRLMVDGREVRALSKVPFKDDLEDTDFPPDKVARVRFDEQIDISDYWMLACQAWAEGGDLYNESTSIDLIMESSHAGN